MIYKAEVECQAGLQEEGLFRRSPSSSLLRSAQEAYDRGNVVSLQNFADPHLAAVLLKKYLRDLPEPIFPEGMYEVVKQCPFPSAGCDNEENDIASIQFVREVLFAQLVPCAYILLSHVLRELFHFFSSLGVIEPIPIQIFFMRFL